MAEVGNAPKGTFHCGCGASVLVTASVPAGCFGMADNGERCRFPAVREAMLVYKVSLCRDHLDGYRAVLDLIRDAEKAASVIDEAYEIERNELRRPDRDWTAMEARRIKLYAGQSVVYYVRIGDLIKIGTTVNMKARMGALVPDEILATEPGDQNLEAMRHKQFAGLRVKGERFRDVPELRNHIAMIRDHFGPPQMTGYIRENGTRVRARTWDLKPEPEPA
jgi:hypothetical protein